MKHYVYEGLPSGVSPILSNVSTSTVMLPGQIQTSPPWIEPKMLEPVRRVNPLCSQCMSRICEHVCPPPKLSFRMVQILLLLAVGTRNKEIASQLGIKEGTVKVYLSRTLFPALGVESRLQAGLWASKNIQALQT